MLSLVRSFLFLMSALYVSGSVLAHDADTSSKVGPSQTLFSVLANEPKRRMAARLQLVPAAMKTMGGYLIPTYDPKTIGFTRSAFGHNAIRRWTQLEVRSAKAPNGADWALSLLLEIESRKLESHEHYPYIRDGYTQFSLTVDRRIGEPLSKFLKSKEDGKLTLTFRIDGMPYPVFEQAQLTFVKDAGEVRVEAIHLWEAPKSGPHKGLPQYYNAFDAHAGGEKASMEPIALSDETVEKIVQRIKGTREGQIKHFKGEKAPRKRKVTKPLDVYESFK